MGGDNKLKTCKTVKAPRNVSSWKRTYVGICGKARIVLNKNKPNPVGSSVMGNLLNASLLISLLKSNNLFSFHSPLLCYMWILINQSENQPIRPNIWSIQSYLEETGDRWTRLRVVRKLSTSGWQGILSECVAL